MFSKIIQNLFISSMFLLLAVPAMVFGMEPGKWEITSRVEMPGMPMQIPPTTTTQCLTESEPAPADFGTESGCRLLDMKTVGETTTWSVECDNEGEKVKGNGNITYNGATFSGTVTAVMEQEGQTMEVVTRLSGKKIGPCDK